MDKRPEFNDELLSAYLDDQLLPAERADVEARLAHDGDAQALVRELREAAEAVRQLPRVAAPRDLKAAILRAAEQIDLDESDGEATTVALASGRTTLSVGRSRRGWFWAGLAVAAALMIMFLNRNGEVERDVAQVGGEGTGQVALDDERGAAGPDETGVDTQRGRARPVDTPADARHDALAVAEPDGGGALDASRGMARDAETRGTAAALSDATNLATRADEIALAQESISDGGNAAAKGQVAWSDRYFKNVDQRAAGREDIGVVLSNVEAAFGEPVEQVEPDASVYFVTVNVTPEAVRNNAVANSLGANSIALVSQAEAATPGLAKLTFDAEGVTADERLERQRGGQRPSEPDPSAQPPASALGVIAVEALPEQVAGFLNDVSHDPQNFTAVAVLKEASAAAAKEETGEPVEDLEEAARYNRNADEAIGQVAGNWRFQPTGQSAEPVRVEWYRYAAPAEGTELALNDTDGVNSLRRANGREANRRNAGEPEADVGGYGGGIGGGGRGRGGFRSRAVVEPAPDAAAAEAKGLAGGADPQGALSEVEADAEATRGFGRSVADLPEGEAAPRQRSEDTSLRTKSATDGVTEDFADKSAVVATGKAWLISPLQIRDPAAAEPPQQLAQTAEQFGLAARSPQAGGRSSAPSGGEAQNSRAELLRAGADRAKEVEALRPQSGVDLKDRSSDTSRKLGERLTEERQAGTEPAAAPPPRAARSAATLGAEAPRPQAASREAASENAAKAPAQSNARKPVRVLLFFNVVPAQPQPAAAVGGDQAGDPETPND